MGLAAGRKNMQVSEWLSELRHFYCTENYYRHWLKGLLYTDGVKFLAQQAGRGGRNWQLDIFARLGLIAEPSDAALAAAMHECGLIPAWTKVESSQ